MPYMDRPFVAPKTIEEAWEVYNAKPLLELTIGGRTYKIGELAKDKLDHLNGIGERAAKGAATKDDLWPYWGILYLLNAGEPTLALKCVNGITPEHVAIAGREIFRQVIVRAFSAGPYAGKA